MTDKNLSQNGPNRHPACAAANQASFLSRPQVSLESGTGLTANDCPLASEG